MAPVTPKKTPKKTRTEEELKALRRYHAIRSSYERKQPGSKRRKLNFPEEEQGERCKLKLFNYRYTFY